VVDGEESSISRPPSAASRTDARKTLSGGDLTGLGLFFAAAVVAPLLLGIGVDALTHKSPLFLFIGLIAGIAAAITGGYRRLKPYL
jgi:F0F1-type ATP synthase assembly protein I